MAHTLELAEQLRDELERLSEVQVYAAPRGEPWCGIVSFTVEGVRPQAIETALGAKGIAVRAGLHCAPWAHRWLGTLKDGGSLRISFSHLTCANEIDTFVRGLQAIL